MSSIDDKLRGTGSGIDAKLKTTSGNYEQTKKVLSNMENKLKTNAYLDTKPVKAEALVGANTTPVKAEALIGANAATNGVDPQEAAKVLNDLINIAESRVVKADSLEGYAKKLSPERIQEIKDTSPILNPEKYHKDVDLGYYARRAAEGLSSAGESIIDTMTRWRENVSYPALKAGEFVTSLGGKYDNRVSDAFSKLLERNKEASIEAVESTPVENYAKMTDFIYNDVNGLQKLAGDVVSGGSAMLPMLAANAVVPGSGYAILGAQGYGSGIQQAYQKTGELGLKEDMYGLLSGLSEIAIEKISGGIGGLGDGVVDNIASKMIKNGLIRSATGEGIEEAVSTFIDPYLQRLTYDKGAEGAKASEVLRSALVGALTSMLLQGGSAAVNSVNTSLNTDKSVKKLNKIDNKTLNQLEEINKNLGKGNTFSEVANLPEMDKATQKQLKGLENLIPQKNVASELPTTPSQQPMQQTNRTEGKMAQNGNIEQIAKNIENNNILEYNNDRGVENGEKINGERYTFEVRDGLHEESTQENRQYNTTEYEQWEQSLKPIPRERLTTEEIADIDNTQKEYGKTVNLIDENENSNKYSGGASLTKKGQLNISRQQAEYFGLKNMIEHEVVEDDILYDDVANDILTPAIELIMKDTKFDDQKKAFWKGQTDNIPTDELIAKDILCDRFAEIKNNTKMKYDNVLSPDVNTTVDMALQNYYKQVYGKELNIKNDAADTQSAFSMPKNYIDPAQDIQKATEFVSKATVEDIDTLNKMVEEAEKHPDRVDLQFFAEKARARLEKLSREQIESMVEEGIKQNKISYNESIYRNLRRALGEKGYKYVKEHILDKLDAAKLDNVNMKIEIANDLKKNVVDKLGIKKGSKESELVQKYGEKEITLDELKEATPNWENVVKADKWFREMYDKLIDEINESRMKIYPYVEEKIEATELELKVIKQQIKDIEENGTPNYKKDAEIRLQIENIQNRINSKTEAVENASNKNTLEYKNNLRIRNEAEERLSELKDLLELRAENKLQKLTEKAKKLQEMLDSEELWRGKRIPKRKDYYRHFQEMTEGFEALGNILATPSEISSSLSGISENTKPNAKWLGLAQRRLGNKTKYDAVGGFLNYLDSASYAINIDPEIKRIRDFTEEIRNATKEDATANRLIEYLTDYANDLAGKTNPMDRYLQKIIPGGRKAMKAISWVTNRIKSNAVLGNFNSAAAQILNLPQGLADIKYPKNIAIGIMNTVSEPFVKSDRYKDSQFINERFNSDIYSQFDEKLINQPKKMAVWLLGALDEFATKTIWNGEYSKAVDSGIKDPVRYADYKTRDLVAGRGIGELSLNQRSKTIGLLAPFTVEVANYWGVVKDFVDARDFGALILLQVFGHLFNKGLEELGISAGTVDFIDAFIDAWNTEGGIDKKVGRIAGEYLSNSMFGQQLASLYPENGANLGVYELPTRSELFGDADPTRMGTGSVLSKAITNPITSVVLPWGGTQVNKTVQGLSTYAKGGSYSKDAEGRDKLKYPVKQNASNLIKSIMFGKWATPEAKDYIDRGFKALSANQTEGYKKAMKAGITSEQFYDAYDAQRGIKGLGDLTSPYKKTKIDEVTKGLNKKQKTILYDTFDVSKEAQKSNKKVTDKEAEKQKEKLEKEKQLKAMNVKFNK